MKVQLNQSIQVPVEGKSIPCSELIMTPFLMAHRTDDMHFREWLESARASVAAIFLSSLSKEQMEQTEQIAKEKNSDEVKEDTAESIIQVLAQGKQLESATRAFKKLILNVLFVNEATKVPQSFAEKITPDDFLNVMGAYYLNFLSQSRPKGFSSDGLKSKHLGCQSSQKAE